MSNAPAPQGQPESEDDAAPEPQRQPKRATYPAGTICQLLDITPRRLRQLADEGHVPKPVEHGRWDLVGCVRGYVRFLKERAIQSDVSSDAFTTHRARLTKSRADMAELERDRAAGDLLRAADVEAAWAGIVTAVKTRLRGIGAKIAPILEVLGSVQERKDAIQGEIDAALDYLARARVSFAPPADGPAPPHEGDGGEDPPEAGSAAEPDGE